MTRVSDLSPPPLSPLRCLCVWLTVTVAALATCCSVIDTAQTLAHLAIWRGSFEDLVVAIAAFTLLGCAGWLWLVTTVTVSQAARGALPTTAVGPLRRLVLTACGAVVLVGVGAPALAGGGHSAPVLAGLPLPDRASVSAPRAPAPPTSTLRRTATPVDEVVVQTGDSLWSITVRTLAPDADLHDVDAAWRALYAANRDVIGADPALIRPGQRLRLTRRPAPHH